MAVNQKTVLKEVARLLKSSMPDNFVMDIHIFSEPEVNSRRGQQPLFVNALLHGLSL